MTTYYQADDSVMATSVASVSAANILSKRRPAWISAFALFSIGLFIVSPGLAIATTVVFALSVTYVLAADLWPDQIGTGSKIYPVIGALLAATLLWIAIQSGAYVVNAMGMDGNANVMVITSAVSLAIYAGLILCEFALAILVQLLISNNRDAALSVAIVINSKYAGLFS